MELEKEVCGVYQINYNYWVLIRIKYINTHLIYSNYSLF